MPWTDDYLVGNIIIDAEHRYLITLIDIYKDELINSRIRVGEIHLILKNLIKDHVINHFAHEQILMGLAEAHNYKGKEAHIAEHERIKLLVFSLLASPDEKELLQTIEVLIEHTTKYDLELANKLKLSIEGLKHQRESE